MNKRKNILIAFLRRCIPAIIYLGALLFSLNILNSQSVYAVPKNDLLCYFWFIPIFSLLFLHSIVYDILFISCYIKNRANIDSYNTVKKYFTSVQKRINRISLGALLLYFVFLSVWFSISLMMNPVKSIQKDIDASFSQLIHNREVLYQTESKTEDFCIYYYPCVYVDISVAYTKDASDTAAESATWKMQYTYMNHLPTFLTEKFCDSWIQLEQNKSQTDVVQIVPLENNKGFYVISESKTVLVIKEKKVCFTFNYGCQNKT